MSSNNFVDFNTSHLPYIRRVFFHELGHFIASELNVKYFNSVGISEIKLYQCGGIHEIEYYGKSNHKLPPGEDQNSNSTVPIERLAKYLVQVSYGCILQALYTESSVIDCIKENGEQDFKASKYHLQSNNLLDLEGQLKAFYVDHINDLKKSVDLKSILGLNPLKYLEEVSKYRSYGVNLKMLRNDLKNILREYIIRYICLVRKHNEIIKSK